MKFEAKPQMEQEIDELFLDANIQRINQHKIRNLEECMENLPRMYPYLKQIKAKCQEIHSSLELYTVKLECLAGEMRDIEEENTRLENEVLYQTDIYEHLKDLLVSIEIKEDHFVALESESFESVEGLCNIEKALDVLNNFHVDSYDIRIVRERRERINNALRGFYKRFVTHMSKFLVRSDSTGELKVHKGLYGVIKRFKKIFKAARRYDDYYKVICSIYIAHSEKLYEREFDLHLKTILRLLRDSVTARKVNTSLNVLFESYRSIISCENRFLESMEIVEGLDEIFKHVSLLISEFVEDVYELADVETLTSLSGSWRDVNEKESVYYNFQEDLKKMYGKLEMRYLDKERVKEGSEDGVRRLEELLVRSGNKDFNRHVVEINLDRIMKQPGDNSLKSVVHRWRLIHRVSKVYDEHMDEIDRADEELEARFERSCSDFILEDESKVMERLERVLSYIEGERSFRAKVIGKIRSSVLENIEDNKEEASALLTRALDA